MGKLAKVLVGILIFAALCVLVYVNVMKWHKKTIQKAITAEQKTWQEKTEGLEQRVAGGGPTDANLGLPFPLILRRAGAGETQRVFDVACVGEEFE